MPTKINNLERRVIELSYKHKLTHVSSCLNCVNLIDWIYEQRKENEPFVLGNSHAALALYVVLEKYGLCDAEEMIEKHGVHAGRDMANGLWVSGGSLGQPETVACGLALADKNRRVWLVTSDGSSMEGATQEAFRVGKKYCPNLNIDVVFNGFGAYGVIELDLLTTEVFQKAYDKQIYYVDQKRYPSWLRGLPGHYLQLNEQQYEELMQ